VKPPISIVFVTIIILIAATALLSGCGYNPDQPVYDYTLNPDGFPLAALAVLKGIDTDSLAGYSAITDAFGQLYSVLPELLDNPDWQQVIQRVGARFRYKADKVASQGFARYSEAAALYTLAAFARPNDARSTQQRDLFDVWTRAIEDSLVTESDWRGEKGPGLVMRLKTARCFVLDDSLSAVFASRYLVPLMFFSSPQFNLLNVRALDSLSELDRALASYLGLNVKPARSRVAVFTRPTIELVAAEIVSAGPGTVRAAFFFIPRQKIDSNYTVGFRLKGSDPTGAGSGDITLDFLPTAPTSRWKVGRVAVAYRKFRYQGPPMEAEVGLYDNAGGEPRFVAIEGTGAKMVTLPADIFLTSR
jgi:hypothetical protein